eukprot:1341345-Rhodomonas_salina.2
MRRVRKGFDATFNQLSPSWPHPVEFYDHDLTRNVTKMLLNDLLTVVCVVIICKFTSSAPERSLSMDRVGSVSRELTKPHDPIIDQRSPFRQAAIQMHCLVFDEHVQQQLAFLSIAHICEQKRKEEQNGPTTANTMHPPPRHPMHGSRCLVWEVGHWIGTRGSGGTLEYSAAFWRKSQSVSDMVQIFLTFREIPNLAQNGPTRR